jgi:hypothetical protein
MVQAVYVPRENGDPIKTTLHGIPCRAHVPFDITDKFGDVQEQARRTLATGQVVNETVTRRIPLEELIRGSTHFEVVGEKQEGEARRPGRPAKPKNDEQYRAYALAWIREAEDAEVMATRWAGEEALRVKCGVGEDDIELIKPFYDAKHSALTGAASIEDGDE